MPRSKEPSAAARQLARELAARGLKPGYRAIEDWAARGLAPRPARQPLGRGRGTTSTYPPGAAAQYAAVASVMRRGLPWQASVLKLLARGHLPADPGLVRQAYRDLLASLTACPGDDPLSYAEEVAEQAAATPAGRPFLRAFERNLRRSAQLLEPGTEIAPAARGVLATLTLLSMGEPDWSPGALIEAMAALRIPVADLADDDRQALTRFAAMFTEQITAGPVLAAIAAHAPLERIQAAIPPARELLAGALPPAVPGLTQDVREVLTAFAALVVVSIENAGGDQAIGELAARARSGATPPRWNTPATGNGSLGDASLHLCHAGSHDSQCHRPERRMAGHHPADRQLRHHDGEPERRRGQVDARAGPGGPHRGGQWPRAARGRRSASHRL